MTNRRINRRIYRREVGAISECVEPIKEAREFDGAPDDAVRTWLEKQEHLKAPRLYLLAHADDGVIWGRLENGNLTTAHDAAGRTGDCALRERALAVSPPLRTQTLQQARLFGSDGEILLWRDGDNHLHARLIRPTQNDEDARWTEAFDEPQMLWGTASLPLSNDFHLWREGAEGLRHALPLSTNVAIGQSVTNPPRLRVRHFINYTASHVAYVEASRLVGFLPDPKHS